MTINVFASCALALISDTVKMTAMMKITTIVATTRIVLIYDDKLCVSPYFLVPLTCAIHPISKVTKLATALKRAHSIYALCLQVTVVL